MSLAIRIWNLAAGTLSRLVWSFERRNPGALLEREKENLRALIGRFNEGLVSHAALAERLIGQVRRGESEHATLTANISAHVQAGNRDAAARRALQRKEVEARLVEDRAELTEAERTYQSLVRTRDAAVADARKKIEAVRREIGELEVKRAVADLESMAAAMVSNLGGAGDSLERLQSVVAEERDRAAGRARVASSALDVTDLATAEAEQAALADQALAEFLEDASRPSTVLSLAPPGAGCHAIAPTADLVPARRPDC